MDTWWFVSRAPSRGVVDTSVERFWAAMWYLSSFGWLGFHLGKVVSVLLTNSLLSRIQLCAASGATEFTYPLKEITKERGYGVFLVARTTK
jgi:hypothetical protein